MLVMPNPSSRELFVADSSDPEKWFDKWFEAFTIEARIANARSAEECSDDCPGCECEDDMSSWGGPCSHCRMH